MLHRGFRIGEHMPTPLLLGLFLNTGQPEEKRFAACIALGAKPDDAAFFALLEGLRADDWRIRLFSLEAIKRHPRAAEADGAIIGLLFDVDDQVRQMACKIVGERKLHQAHDGILELLKTENPDVRDVALSTLSKIWEEDDFERVFAIFEGDERRAVRIAAAKTLRKQAHGGNWRRLFEAWRGDREVRHRVWSCELAGLFGGASEWAALQELRKDRNRNVRLAAQEALERLNGA